jgi:hypothetical protein
VFIVSTYRPHCRNHCCRGILFGRSIAPFRRSRKDRASLSKASVKFAHQSLTPQERNWRGIYAPYYHQRVRCYRKCHFRRWKHAFLPSTASPDQDHHPTNPRRSLHVNNRLAEASADHLIDVRTFDKSNASSPP